MTNWDDFRYFLALARSGSLSATARALGVDHTTVARRVSSLEERLGLRLFDRLPRGYELTPAGAEVRTLAERLEADAFAIDRHARGRPGEVAGAVRMSAPPVFASHFLARRLVRLRVQAPLVTLELIGNPRTASLSRREADIAVRLSRPQDEALLARRIGTMGYGLYASPDYVAGRDPASWEFVGYDDSLDHVPQQRWLKRLADGRPFVFRSNDLASLWTACRAGMGVAAIPHFLGCGEPGLVRLAVDADPEGRELWLLVHRDIGRSAAVRLVMDTVAEVVAANRTLLEGGD